MSTSTPPSAPSQPAVRDFGWRERTAVAVRRVARDGIEHLPPSYFSLVMATGIVSIASHLLGMASIAYCLFVLNIVVFVVLWLLTGLRILLYRQRFLDDLKKHAVGPGFFTMVAGTCVIGVQFVNLTGDLEVAAALWVIAALLWLLITCTVFAAIMVCPRKPSLRFGLSGLWLIAAVATQSVSVLGTPIAARFPAQQETILFLSLLFYFMGGMLYLNIISLIFCRLTFVALTPAELTPPYWINMGATAITTQAGASLLLHSDQSRLLAELGPFLKGFTLFFWAAGTWWIPLLVVLGIWRHLVRGVPLTYDPQLWGLVFPLGMYTASTHAFARATDLGFLLVVPEVSIYLALLAWALTFTGLLRSVGRTLLARHDG